MRIPCLSVVLSLALTSPVLAAMTCIPEGENATGFVLIPSAEGVMMVQEGLDWTKPNDLLPGPASVQGLDSPSVVIGGSATVIVEGKQAKPSSGTLPLAKLSDDPLTLAYINTASGLRRDITISDEGLFSDTFGGQTRMGRCVGDLS